MPLWLQIKGNWTVVTVFVFKSGSFVLDIRAGVCFTELIQGQCRTEVSRRMSFKDCCCSAGKGWSEGRVCQLCPLRNTGKCFSGKKPWLTNDVNFHQDGIGRTDGILLYSYPRCNCIAVINKQFATMKIWISDAFARLCEIGEQTLPDQDLCSQFVHLCQNGRCISTPGSYRCECSLGFRLNANDACIGNQHILWIDNTNLLYN